MFRARGNGLNRLPTGHGERRALRAIIGSSRFPAKCGLFEFAHQRQYLAPEVLHILDEMQEASQYKVDAHRLQFN